AAAPVTTDEFTSSRLGLQWQWNANHQDDWHSLVTRPGWLRLYAQPAQTDLSLLPNLLLQKFPAREFAVETSLDLSGGRAGDEAGLIIAGRAHAELALRRTEHSAQLVFRNGGDQVLAEIANPAVKLRVTVREGGRCSF